MSIYRYADASPVSRIAFHYANGRPTVALIEASNTATAEQIAAASAALKENGMSLVPVTVNERDMLQVTGFLTEEAVIDTLAAQDMVKGAPEIDLEVSDLPSPKSKFKTFLEKYSFRLAGALNLIGDVAMHFKGYGEIRNKTYKDKKTGAEIAYTPEELEKNRISGTYDLIGGGLYTVGGLNAAAFGNSKSKAAPLTERTAEFIAHAVDPQANPLKPTKESGNFFRRHAADTTLAAYTVGAGAFLTQGVSAFRKLGEELKLPSITPDKAKEIKAARTEKGWKAAYGTSSLICKLLSLFIKEKPKSEEDKPKSNNPIMRTINWFREKPLRIFGLGSVVTDLIYAGYTYADWKKGKGLSPFNVVTTICYLSSDFLSAVSSKNLISKPLDADGERGVIARTAQTIAAQSPEKQEELVSKTAQFLSEQAEIQHGKKSIAASLAAQLQRLGSNPWATKVAEEPVVQPLQR